MSLAIVLCAVVFLLIGLTFAFGPSRAPVLLDALRAFVAFFFLLLGLRMTFSSIRDPEPLLGAFFASLALTFFWVMVRRGK
jgi:predicted Na+-dependent transporter